VCRPAWIARTEIGTDSRCVCPSACQHVQVSILNAARAVLPYNFLRHDVLHWYPHSQRESGPQMVSQTRPFLCVRCLLCETLSWCSPSRPRCAVSQYLVAHPREQGTRAAYLCLAIANSTDVSCRPRTLRSVLSPILGNKALALRIRGGLSLVT